MRRSDEFARAGTKLITASSSHASIRRSQRHGKPGGYEEAVDDLEMNHEADSSKAWEAMRRDGKLGKFLEGRA